MPEHLKRINELRNKKDELKSHRLGKKESEELRKLVDENADLYMIFSWKKEDAEYIEKVLKENGIIPQKYKMPDRFNFTFF